GRPFAHTLARTAAQVPGARGRGGFSVRRGTIFIVGYVIGIIGAGAVAAGREWGMYGVTVYYTLLLVISIWNGWMIMQGIGRGEKFRKTKKPKHAKGVSSEIIAQGCTTE